MLTTEDLRATLVSRERPAPPVEPFLNAHAERMAARNVPARAIAVAAIVCVITTLAVTLSLVATGHTGHPAAARQPPPFTFVAPTRAGTVIPQAVRQLAEPISGELAGGGRFDLAAQKGRVVLLRYWASWCRPCVPDIAGLGRLDRPDSTAPVAVVGIAVRDSQSAVAAAVNHLSIAYPVVLDPGAKTAHRLGDLPASALPVTVLVDRRGEVAAVYLGGETVTMLARTIAALDREP